MPGRRDRWGRRHPRGGRLLAVDSDGGVFTFGDAQFKRSASNLHLNKPVVDIVPTASAAGYWLVAADGGVRPIGDAPASSDNPLPGMQLNQPVWRRPVRASAARGAALDTGGYPLAWRSARNASTQLNLI
jgi:hypothetical protein